MIDVDDETTWPAEVRAWVAQKADELRGVSGRSAHTSDLAVSPEENHVLRRLFADELLLAYHCTRLLEHELSWVRREGLLTLTEELVSWRIEAAHEHRYLSASDRDVLLRSHAFAAGQRDRGDKLYGVLGRAAFDEDPEACWTLLATWGGEGIYNVTPGIEEKYGHLGKAAIVVIGVDAAPDSGLWSFPDVGNVFVAKALGMRRAFADLVQSKAVPPEDVHAIWQPGDAEYDRHSALPR